MNLPALKDIGPKSPSVKQIKKIAKLQKAGKHNECLALCKKLVLEKYESKELLHLFGLSFLALEQFNEAIVCFNRALEFAPQDATLISSLGVCFLHQQENELAIDLFKQATKLDPKYYDGWRNLGVALRAQDRFESAELAFTCAHHLDKTQIEPLINLVYILCDVRGYDQAARFMDEKIFSGQFEITPAIRINRLQIAARLHDLAYVEKAYPEFDRSELSNDERAAIDNIWAHSLEIMGRYEEEIELLEQWTDKDTIHKDQIMSQLALAYAQAGQMEQAINFHKEVLEEKPDHIAVRYNLADLQFRSGHLAEAYENYESRWLWREFPSKRRIFDAPRWKGEPLEGKKLLIWREQGIGDEVRFASVFPELENSGGEITFECAPKLIPLWENAFPWMTFREEGEIECRGDEDYTGFDYQIPIGSLCPIFRPTIESFKGKQSTWIKRDHRIEAEVRDLIGVSKGEMLVGICWRSAVKQAGRDRYMLEVEQLLPFKDLPGVKWVNVQYDGTGEEVEEIRDLGLPVYHFENLDQKDDLISACNLIGACDLVITVGGSVADLAGALGVPFITYYAKTTNMRLGTDYCPWFPTCDAYVRPANTGDKIIAEIIEKWPETVKWASNINKDNWVEHQGLNKAGSGISQLDLDYPYPMI